MKRFIVAVLLSLSLVSTCYAEYSSGYRMGLLQRYQESGWINKSGEGELNMGNEGIPLIETYKDSKGKIHKNYINPWRFSDENFNPSTNQFIGEYVWIEYENKYINNPFAADTSYRSKQIHSVDPSLLDGISSSEDEGYDATAKSTGIQLGRIVQASKTGLAIKTYEITVQCGTSGNQYKFMTVTHEKVYNFCVLALKAGKLVKVYYDNRGILAGLDIGSNTKYRVFKVEVSGKSLD